MVSVPERRARFEISSSTRVLLAVGKPGVLLSLEKGRLRAFFEALADGSGTERRVAAPGALLAVRGTRYGLEVDGEGRCLLAVFEGTVEVLPTIVGAAPIKVHADEFCTFGARMAPRSAPMKSMGLSERSWGIAQRRQRHVAGFRRPDARDGAREPDTSELRRVHGTRSSQLGRSAFRRVVA